MPEILLVVVIVALLVERVFCQRTHDQLTRRMLNHIEAKSVPELVLLNRTDELPTREPQAAKEVIIPIGA